MSNLNKVLIALVIAQIALVVVVRAGDDPMGVAKLEPILELKADSVTRVAIYDEPQQGTDAKPAIDLVRRGDGWVAASHFDYTVDAKAVDNLIGKLTAMQSRGPTARKAERHKQLKVADDDYLRKIVVTHGGVDTTVFIGSSPKFRKASVRIGGTPETHSIGAISATDIGTSISDWIDPIYLEIPTASIVSMSVENHKGTTTLERGPDGQWANAGGGDAAKPLDQAKVKPIVEAASKLEIVDIVAAAAKPEHGFDHPKARITVGVEDKADGKSAPQRQVFIIEVGAASPGGFFAHTVDKSHVITVASAALNPLVDLQLESLEAAPVAPAPGQPAKP